jgi:hypothetical protein
MTLLLKNGAVFLHVPKTGGVWVHTVLERLDLVKAPLGRDHSDLEHAFFDDRYHSDSKVLRHLLRRKIGSRRAPAAMAANAFKFCFVREPLKWYESYWRFMQIRNWVFWGDELDPYRWHPNAMLNGLGSSDFNQFMHNVNKKRPGYVTEMFGWYARPGVQFVGKQESLQEDLIQAFSMMKLDIDPAKIAAVEKLHETPSHIPKPEWDPALKRETLRLEYPGYVRFGYSTDENQPGRS